MEEQHVHEEQRPAHDGEHAIGGAAPTEADVASLLAHGAALFRGHGGDVYESEPLQPRENIGTVVGTAC